MITIYGIKNCDTMKKAMRWLDQQGIEYRFHDYRKEGLDLKQLKFIKKSLKLGETGCSTNEEVSEVRKYLAMATRAVKAEKARAKDSPPPPPPPPAAPPTPTPQSAKTEKREAGAADKRASASARPSAQGLARSLATARYCRLVRASVRVSRERASMAACRLSSYAPAGVAESAPAK